MKTKQRRHRIKTPCVKCGRTFSMLQPGSAAKPRVQCYRCTPRSAPIYPKQKPLGGGHRLAGPDERSWMWGNELKRAIR